MSSPIVHHLDHSRSQRILWLLEELEVPYTMKTWARGRDYRAPKELSTVHPIGLAPMVELDGKVYCESGAIIETLIDRLGEGRLRPTDPDALADWRFWMHYAEGSVMPPLLIKLITDRLRHKVPFFLKPLTGAVAGQIDAQFTDPQIERHFQFIEAHLTDRTWLLGETFSAADIQMGFPLLAARARVTGDRPAMKAWMARCEARPAFARALEKGGPIESSS